MSNQKFVSIQGNIGSGKSSILKIIQQNFPQLTILAQPLSSWQKAGPKQNVNLLDLYYQNPQRWGFTFQIYAFMSRLLKWSDFKNLNDNNIKISQRSLLSDKYIFASIMRDMDILTQAQHLMYLDCYENLIKMNKISQIKGIIYIKCDPEICSERIKKRARQGQNSISLDYLTKIHQKHQQWLNPQKQQSQDEEEQQQQKRQDSQIKKKAQDEKNVLIIDNTQPIEKNRIVDKVSQWLKTFNE